MVATYPTSGMSQLGPVTGTTAITGTAGRPGSTAVHVPDPRAMPTREGIGIEQELAEDKAALSQYVEGLNQQLESFRLQTQQMVAAIEAQTAEATHQQELAAARAEGVMLAARGGRMDAPPKARRYREGGGGPTPTPGGVTVGARRQQADGTWLEWNGTAWVPAVGAPLQERDNPLRPATPPLPSVAPAAGPGMTTTEMPPVGSPGFPGQGVVPAVPAPARAQVPVTAAQPVRAAPAAGQPASARPAVTAAPVAPEAVASAPQPIVHPFAEAFGVQLDDRYSADALPLVQRPGTTETWVLYEGRWQPIAFEEADAASQRGEVFQVPWDHPLVPGFAQPTQAEAGVRREQRNAPVTEGDVQTPQGSWGPGIPGYNMTGQLAHPNQETRWRQNPDGTWVNEVTPEFAAAHPDPNAVPAPRATATTVASVTPEPDVNNRPFVAPAGYYQTPPAARTEVVRNQFGRTPEEQADAERMGLEGILSFREGPGGLGGVGRRAQGGAGAGRDVLPPGANAIVGEGRDPAGPGLRPELVIDPEAIRQGLVKVTTGASAAELPPDAFVIPLPPRLYDDAAGLFQPFDAGVPVARNPDGRTFTAAMGGRLPLPRRLAAGGMPPGALPFGFQLQGPPPVTSNAQYWAGLGPAGQAGMKQMYTAYGYPQGAEQGAFVARTLAPPAVNAAPYYG